MVIAPLGANTLAKLATGIADNLLVSCLSTLITSAKEVMFLPVFVCLSVCLCVSKITQKLWTDFSEILRVCRAWHKLPVIQF